MAGKGGGAWKVAYADFVTAMMAFFLVMWLTAQDQQIKRAVSYYFMDPLGASRKPSRGGGIVNEDPSGSVPQGESVGGSRGRHPWQNPTNEPSRATKAVGDWLHNDGAARDHWAAQAAECRDAAAANPDVKSKALSRDDAAAAELARRLKADLSMDVAAQESGLRQNLLFSSLAEVNWKELAEHLLSSP